MDKIKLILGTMTFSDQANTGQSRAMLDDFVAAGNHEIDTAYVYNEGKTEELLGELISPQVRHQFYIATKVNPWNDNGLQAQEVKRQFEISLKRLNVDSVDLLYLHSPDLDTPIEQTLGACWELFQQGKFKDFGLSNYAAWQVAEVMEICRARGWMQPRVYQGMYNALTRDVERELFPCLRNYDMSFYVYNPLAGGLLTGKHRSFDQIPDQGRFGTFDGYQERYWKQEYFKVINQFNQACAEQQIAPAEAALRWLLHHSQLSNECADGIILGASKPAHLIANIDACGQGPLSESIVDVLQQGWEIVRPNCIKYFRP